MKINLLPTLILLLAFTSCSKEQKKGGNDPIIGTWNYNGNKIVINNTEGEPDPFSVTAFSDSLIIKYPPAVNFRYKLLFVDDSKMAVTSNDSLFVYKKE